MEMEMEMKMEIKHVNNVYKSNYKIYIIYV